MNRSARTRLFVALPLSLALLACGSEPPAEPADLLLTNGKIVTVDSAHPQVEALAAKGGRIIALGTSAELARYRGQATEVIDLGGRLAIPGLIEGHGHFLRTGGAKLELDLTTARTWDDIVAMVRDAVAKAQPGQWIIGRGWHQEKWDRVPQPNVDGVPLHTELSRLSPNNPVHLTHASGHASFANAKAMQLAGIGRTTKNPSGGEIVKDSKGEPTGLMRETAQRLVSAARDRGDSQTENDREAEFRKIVQLAGDEAVSNGVTSFQDAGSNFATIDRLKSMADRGELPVRLYVMVRRESNDSLAAKLPQYRLVGYGNHFLTVRSIKRQIDGALGPHGAWLLQPYLDLPSSSGLTLEDPKDIERTAEIAIANGFQVNTHAIGDRANKEVLDIYERVFAKNPDQKDLRWRIEHAQHLDPADVPRFAKRGVIAAMQGVHATSDGPWVLKRLGPERAKSGAYIWRDLIKAGVVIGNGTDVPVEKIDPLDSFYASVARKMKDSTVFYGEQRMTREEALRSYTINNAFAAFEDSVKGSLTVGKLADITVLAKDIMTIPEDEIPSTRVDYTIIGGQVRYRRDTARGNGQAP